jgi:hypothetical protein
MPGAKATGRHQALTIIPIRAIAVISYSIALITALVLGSVLLSAHTHEEAMVAGEPEFGASGQVLR